MVWNIDRSILGTGDTSSDVEREADVIFTAAFVGMSLFQSEKRGGLAWRVDMEPNTDDDKDRDKRTADDRRVMKDLNDACCKVNQLVRTERTNDMGGVGWGLTPAFDRGGMIAAGAQAGREYAHVNKDYAKVAFAYLSASRRAARDGQRAGEMYIGRGAYCGLVIDDEGNAVTAMSTICTALNENTQGVGRRWLPPLDAAVRVAQYPREPDKAAWGIIGGAVLQKILAEQGMRFFPRQDDTAIALDENTNVVGYTHGMIRSIYECIRIGQGTAFEMSIGSVTYKLASCMSCSSFMMANGRDASSTHLGKGESWAPCYSAEANNPSHHQGVVTIEGAIEIANGEYSKFMHKWLPAGVSAMSKDLSWIAHSHHPALAALDAHLRKFAKADNTVARDLYLDAITLHKSDLQRLKSALAFGNVPRRFCGEDAYDWCLNRVPDAQAPGLWASWVNPFTQEQIEALHSLPPRVRATYQIQAWGAPDDSCALQYWLRDGEGVEKYQGILAQPAGADTGTAQFTVLADDVSRWQIKIGNDRSYARVRLDQPIAIGVGDRYSYVVTLVSAT